MEKLKQRVKEYYKEYDLTYCQQYIKEHCKEEYQEIITSVQRMMNNTFVFDDTWDMEPCSFPYTLQPMHFDKTYNDDLEWIFMLNRQEYLDKFMIAYMIDGNIEYVEKAKEFIFEWIKQVTMFAPSNPTTRTLDTGIRCFSWLKVLMLMIELEVIEDQEIETIVHSIEQQLQYLKESYIDKYTLSNWGILQTTAIIACYTILQETIDCKEEYLFAKEEIVKQIEMQILEDGTQWEQSIMYHVEVYKSLLKVVQIDPQYKEILLPILKSMASYIQALTGPDNKQLAIGDSDVSDTRDVLTLSAILFETTDTVYSLLPTLPIESILLFGRNGIEIFLKLPKQKVEVQANHFKESGQITIRHQVSYLYFKNGPMSSGHSHSDENTVCLYHQGKPIFIDPGRYTYNDTDMRYYLKSAYSHSSCIIDDVAPEKIKDSWDYEKYPQPIHTYFNHKEGCYYMEGSYLATTNKNIPYIHKRKVVMVTDAIWVIVDDISCQGKHKVSTGFVLDSKVQYKNNKINHLQIYSEQPFFVNKTMISKKYNELEESTKIIKEQTFTDRTQVETVCMDESMEITKHEIYQVNKTTPLQNSCAYEFKNTTSHFLVILMHDEIHTGNKICIVDGIKVRGKCIVYDKKTNKMIRLKN